MEISERKKSIIAILSKVAELGAARMEEKIGKAGLRDATIGTGIVVDKTLALTGQNARRPCRLPWSCPPQRNALGVTRCTTSWTQSRSSSGKPLPSGINHAHRAA